MAGSHPESLAGYPRGWWSAVDLTPGNHVVPPFSLGSPDDYAISPDSKEVCFTMNTDEAAAISTNNDLFVVPITGENAASPRRITPNPASDSSPQYSPDGKYLHSVRNRVPAMRATASVS